MGDVIELHERERSKFKEDFKQMLRTKYGKAVEQLSDKVIDKIQATYAEDIISITEDIIKAKQMLDDFIKTATQELGNTLILCAMVDKLADFMEDFNITKKLPTDDELILIYDNVLAIELDNRLSNAVMQVVTERVNDIVASQTIHEE